VSNSVHSALGLPSSLSELGFQGADRVPNNVYPANRYDRFIAYSAAKHYPAGSIMMPLISHELMATVVQLLCYFCTAVGIAWGLLIAQQG
jgi:hypothetical protein